MSANQSNLSASQYGYDVVVATTQDSINMNMKEYLSAGDQQEIRLYWQIDQTSGNPVAVDEATLLAQLNQTSPFNLPNWTGTGTKPAALNCLSASTFLFGFRAKIGLPSGYAPDSIPDLIELDPQNNQVTFNLLCSEFQIVQANVFYTLRSYTNISQPDGAAWIISTKVPLSSITDNTNLPAAVQAQLNNLGATAFSVQQLILDLDNAFLESVPTIENLDSASPAYSGLSQFFVGAYFSSLKSQSLPALGYTLTANNAVPDPSTLRISDLKMEANPFYDANGAVEQLTGDATGIQTLNYVCGANGRKVNTVNAFNWNWVDTAADEGDFDGVAAINRNTLRDYFTEKLANYVRGNCYVPSVKVTSDGITVEYDWGMTVASACTPTTPATGQTVLSYAYAPDATSDQAGLNGCLGKMSLQPSFNLTVDFVGTTIVINQHLVVNCYVENGSTGKGGNIIDKAITDTYSLGIDPAGKLAAVLGTPVVTDNSETPGVNGFLNFFSDLNTLLGDAEAWINSISSMTFTDVPVSLIQGFIFPGGKTFVFKDAGFSDNQDLISHITYIDPS